MEEDSQDEFGAAYERLLALCAPLTFPAPWGFLRPHSHCRGPVRDPGAALAGLRAEFPDPLLSAAGLLEPGPDGRGRLPPALAGPAAAVVPLRRHPLAPPFALLTAAGCLPRRLLPARAALEDAQFGPLTRNAVLVVAADVLEVALLWSLTFAATLADGLDTLGAAGLREVDGRFGRGTRLALLGWCPLVPSAGPSAAVAPAAARLAAARVYLGLPLAGVKAWEFFEQELGNLRFRLELRDADLVLELLRASTEQWEDVEWLCPGPVAAELGPPPPPGYAAAQEALMAALAERREGAQPASRLREPLAAYEAAVQRELVAPLQRWALEGPDPVARAAGAELANVGSLLHRMAPRLADLQYDQLTRPRGAEDGPPPPPLLAQYLALAGRFGGLMRDLAHWRKA
jgi:hypothetical protein